jgi:hypothetical protein
MEGEDFVVIDGVAYLVHTSGAKESVVYTAGHTIRSYAGNVLSTVRDEFDGWTMTVAVSEAAYQTLKAAVRLGRIVDVEGTFTPNPVRATVKIAGDYVPDGEDFERAVNLTIEEAEKVP